MYKAPELDDLDEEVGYTYKADIFSLGVVIYWLIEG